MKFTSRQKKGIILVALLCSPWLLCQAWIAVGAPDEHINSMPTSCPEDSANCAHLGGDATYRMDGEYTLTVNLSSTEMWLKVERYIENVDADILVEDGPLNGVGIHYVHFVERTSFWRFPDDVFVLVSALDDDTCSLELHSQSRLGVGDLGVNPDRLEELYASLIG